MFYIYNSLTVVKLGILELLGTKNLDVQKEYLMLNFIKKNQYLWHYR